MDKFKHLCDGLAACGAVVTVMGWLPTVLGTIASGLAIVWYLLRIYDWFKGKKN